MGRQELDTNTHIGRPRRVAHQAGGYTAAVEDLIALAENTTEFACMGEVSHDGRLPVRHSADDAVRRRNDRVKDDPTVEAKTDASVLFAGPSPGPSRPSFSTMCCRRIQCPQSDIPVAISTTSLSVLKLGPAHCNAHPRFLTAASTNSLSAFNSGLAHSSALQYEINMTT